MIRALITGGAGFVGSHLAELLLRNQYQVTIIDNLSTGRLQNIEHLAANPNFSYAIEDIRNIHVIDRLVSECDIIFHLAAAVGVRNIIDRPINTIEVNIGGGGGYGLPADRDPVAIHRDVSDGYVTVAAARRGYPHAFADEASDPNPDHTAGPSTQGETHDA